MNLPCSISSAVFFFSIQISNSITNSQSFFNLLNLDSFQPSSAGCKYNQQVCAQSDLTFPDYSIHRTPDLIRMKGYPVENHEVTTNDGYILSVFRIPHGKTKAAGSSKGKVPVYFLHGLPGSSANWMWQPDGKGLAFMLADAGFDIWLGNVRGSSYSNRSTRYSNKDLRYWDFDLTDIGKSDIPAAIDYIVNHTGKSNIYYVCYSMGCGQFVIAAILNPTIKKRVSTAIMLAPGIYLEHYSPFQKTLLAPILNYQSMRTFSTFAGGQFPPERYIEFINKNLFSPCTKRAMACGTCSLINKIIFGSNFCQTNVTILPGFLTHLLDTASVKMWSQFTQWAHSGNFAPYDYGQVINRKMYGSKKPGPFDWSKYTVPTVVFYSLNDQDVSSKDILRAAKMMGKSLKECNKVQEKASWTHADFLAGIDADTLVYNRIVEIMLNKKYG